MKILVIRYLTRGLQSNRKRCYSDFFCFSSGPWSTVPKANFLIGTMEHGPKGKLPPWDRGARS